jgi:hypothetical protein
MAEEAVPPVIPPEAPPVVVQDGAESSDDEIDLGVIPAGVLVLENVVDERDPLEKGNHIFTLLFSSLDCIIFGFVSH